MKALDKKISAQIWNAAVDLVARGIYKNKAKVLEAIEVIINAAVEEGAHATEDFVITVHEEFDAEVERELQARTVRNKGQML